MLDENELMILKELRENARKSLSEISNNLNIPVSTTFNKLKKIEEAIHKYTTVLDFSHVGCAVRAVFLLKNVDNKALFYISQSKHTNNLKKTFFGGTFILESAFKNMNQLELFKERLSVMEVNVEQTVHIVDELKKESFLAFL